MQWHEGWVGDGNDGNDDSDDSDDNDDNDDNDDVILSQTKKSEI